MTEPDLSATFEQTFKDIGIPPRPAILDRIQAEMQRDEPHFKALAQLITQDVGLSAGLIKTANSPFYGYPSKARSVHDALNMLGLKAISRAIAGLSLRGAFPKTQEFERFWDASAQVASLSAWLAGHIGVKGLAAADAHTFGLFRDCGIPVLLLRFPAYKEALQEANRDNRQAFTAAELKRFPTDHATIGCLLAQNWWLPEEIYTAIRHHHVAGALQPSPVDLPTVSRNMVAVSQTAEYLIQQTTGLSETREWEKLGPACLAQLGLDDATLAGLLPEVAAVLQASG